MSVELDNVGHKFAATPWLFRHLSARCEDGVSVVIATHDPSIRAQCDAVIDLARFQDEEEQR